MEPAARLVLLLAPVLTQSDPPTQVKPPAKRLNPYAAAGSSRPKSTNPYAKPPTKRRILDEGVGNGAEAAAAQDMRAETQGQLPWAAAGAAAVETSQVRCLPGRNFKQLEDTQAAGGHSSSWRILKQLDICAAMPPLQSTWSWQPLPPRRLCNCALFVQWSQDGGIHADLLNSKADLLPSPLTHGTRSVCQASQAQREGVLCEGLASATCFSNPGLACPAHETLVLAVNYMLPCHVPAGCPSPGVGL